MDILRAAQSSGDRVWLRQQTPPQGAFKPGGGTLQAAIETTGAVTFSDASGDQLTALISSLASNTYGSGGLLIVNNKLFVIVSVPASEDAVAGWTGADFRVWDGGTDTRGKANSVKDAISPAADVNALVQVPGYTIGPISAAVSDTNQLNMPVEGNASIAAVTLDFGGASLTASHRPAADQLA